MWTGHANFAMWLARTAKPKIVVDLGVDLGISTFSFACGLKESNLPGNIIAIDNFGGFFDASPARNTYDFVMAVLYEYSLTNVEVIVGDFYKVSKEWNRGLVDILHIDGGHEYINVKKDYLYWSPKVNKQTGIILFHDVCPVHDGFGVAKLFSEISVHEFKLKGHFNEHSGLGIVTNNADLFQEIVANYPDKFFVGAPPETCRTIEKVYHTSFQTFRDWFIKFPMLKFMPFMQSYMSQIVAGIAALEEAESAGLVPAEASDRALLRVHELGSSETQSSAPEQVSNVPVEAEIGWSEVLQGSAAASLPWRELISFVMQAHPNANKDLVQVVHININIMTPSFYILRQ